mgnify:CR=1 FL=1
MKASVSALVANNLCTGCGVCTSESKGALEMKWNDNGFLIPVHNGKEYDVEKAVKVCPFNPIPDDSVKDEDVLSKKYLKDTTKYDNKIGNYINTYVGYSNQYRTTSSSGGIATYVFRQLLILKIVDFLYIVKEDRGSYSYQLYSNVEDIELISKTRYIPVTMESLFNQIDSLEGKVAISGVACFIKAIRLKQHYNPDLYEKIPFLVGIICGGWKSRFFTEYLAHNSGITGSYNKQEYRIKDESSSASDYSFGAFNDLGDFRQIKMSTVGDMWGTGLFKSRACDFCTDVMTELADISLGDAWLPEFRDQGLGNSIIITRSKLSQKLIFDGISSNDLTISPLDKEKIIQSQKPSFAHRQDAILFRTRLSKLFGKLIPHVRKRVLKSISIPYAIVQIQRERTRSKSFEYWSKFKNSSQFKMKMKTDLYILKWLTIINQKLRNK